MSPFDEHTGYFSFTGVTYIPFTFALLYITYRYLRFYRLTNSKLFRDLHYVFGIFTFVCLTGALSGTVFVNSPDGIVAMLIISSVLLSFGNAVLGYTYTRELKLNISPWFTFTAILLWGLFITILTIISPVTPHLEPNGGVNWGMTKNINLLRSTVYFIGLLPMIKLLNSKFHSSTNHQERRQYLFLTILFSLFLLIIATDFVIEPIFDIHALTSELAILTGALFAVLAYLAAHEYIISRIELQYSNLVENLKDMVIIVDSKGEIIYANPSLLDILGFNESLKNKNLADLIYKEDAAAIMENLTLKNGSGSKNLEFRYINNNNEPIWVETTGNFIPVKSFNKTENAYLLASHDITERKEMERKLIVAMVRAEESDRMKTAFIDNIYHEIRTPLNGILGISNLLLTDQISRTDYENYKSHLQISGDQLTKIIDDLIEISKIESNDINLEVRECDFTNEIDVCIEYFSDNEKIKSKIVELEKIDPELSVMCDFYTVPTIFQQILKNIIDNAIKYTPEGKITIKYTLDENNGETNLIIAISDTGVGIANDELQNIFKPFYKIVDHDNEFVAGTGLGLTITKKLVELVGGKITIESEIGKGSEFSLWFPINSQ